MTTDGEQESWWIGPAWVVAGVVSYWLASAYSQLASLVWIVALGWVGLTRWRQGRPAFYSGFAFGLGVFAPQLTFFYSIFGVAAAALWSILAFWTGVFVWLAASARRRFGPVSGALLAPVLWLGLEYARCELYPLKFAWCALGSLFEGAGMPRV